MDRQLLRDPDIWAHKCDLLEKKVAELEKENTRLIQELYEADSPEGKAYKSEIGRLEAALAEVQVGRLKEENALLREAIGYRVQCPDCVGDLDACEEDGKGFYISCSQCAWVQVNRYPSEADAFMVILKGRIVF